MGTASNAETLMALHLTHAPGDPLRGPSWPSFQSDIVRSIILIRSWSSDRWGGLVQGHREAFTLQSQVTKVLGSAVKPFRVWISGWWWLAAWLSAGLQAHLEPTAVENAAPLLMPYTDAATRACSHPTHHICLCATESINTLQAQTGLGKTYQACSWLTLRYELCTGLAGLSFGY